MSLTAELFGSAPSATEKLTDECNTNKQAAVSFAPTKKAAFDLFALAPQVKKPSRKEKQRLQLQNTFKATKGSQKGEDLLTREVDEDILKTVLVADDTKENNEAQKKKKTTQKQKYLRHALHENKEEESRTVFVGNLANDVKKRSVEKIFKKCGTVESVRIRGQALETGSVEVHEKKEGKKDVGRAIHVLRGDIKKGDNYSAVAYVLFKDASSVAMALEKNGIIVDGRHIVVTAMDTESKAYAPETSVFLGNIAYNTSEEDVWNFFIEKGLADVRRVRLVRDRNTGTCKGFGYVEFKKPTSVSRAISLRGSILNGRVVRIVHVQKLKSLSSVKLSRREKRKRAEQDTSDNRRGDPTKKNKKLRLEKEVSFTRQSDDAGRPAWMGVTTNPRKKIPRDLRQLVDGKKARTTSSGPRAAVKRNRRGQEN